MFRRPFIRLLLQLRSPSNVLQDRTLHHTPLHFRRFTMGSLPASAPTVKVLIAGGSYTGLSTTLNLLDLSKGLSPRLAHNPYVHHPDLPSIDVQITIVDERDGFFHLIGAPLALAETEYSKKAWVKFGDIPAVQAPNVRFVQGSVSSVDCEAKAASVVDGTTKETSTHSYDYFVAASGLRRVWPVVPQSLNRKQYLLEAEEHIYAVTNAKDGVVVVGGGAVGIEMAAELKLVQPDIKVTLVHSRDKLLSSEGLPDETKDKALELLQEAGVECLMGHRLAKSEKVDNGDGTSNYEIEFTNGIKRTASQVVMAMSKSTPTTSYLPQSALNDEGYVKIRPSLAFPEEGVPNADFHFCGGDAAQWSGIKRCGGAMHAGHLIAYNIHQSIMKQHVAYEPKLMELEEVVPMIGLAVGKKAVAFGPGMGTISGEDVAHAYFRDDLGFTIVWDYLQLGGKKEEVAAA